MVTLKSDVLIIAKWILLQQSDIFQKKGGVGLYKSVGGSTVLFYQRQNFYSECLIFISDELYII